MCLKARMHCKHPVADAAAVSCMHCMHPVSTSKDAAGSGLSATGAQDNRHNERDGRTDTQARSLIPGAQRLACAACKLRLCC